jgi:hypothetical protein
MLLHPDISSAINLEAAQQFKQGTYHNIAKEKSLKENSK